MTSRTLRVIVEHTFDERSATKTAMREGDWDDETYVTVGIYNLLTLFRADHASIHANERVDVTLLESPAQQAKHESKRAQASAWNRHVEAQMKGGGGS